MNQYIRFANYSPAADIVVAAVCFVMIILVLFSYINRTRSFKLFLSQVILLLAAAWTDISFYTLASVPSLRGAANWVRCANHGVMLMIFVHYVAYICEITHYPKQRRFLILANLVFAASLVAEIITTAQGPTFFLDDTGIHFVRRGIFIYAYLGYIFLCVYLARQVRNLLFHRIVLGFYGTVTVSFLILIIQGLSNQTSFTITSLMLPVIAMMYVMHSNPYDAALGTNDINSMQDYVRYNYEKKREFIYMSLYMRDFDEDGKQLPLSIQTQIRQFTFSLIRNARLFEVGKGHMILFFLKRQYPDYERKIQDMLDAFFPIYNQYKYDYKIVIGASVDEISRNNEYIGYIKSIHRSMPECAIHRVDSDDIVEYHHNESILKELADIHRQVNLDDPRVLAYCQPVLNVKTGRYDTAEALMRLELKELGLVYPDRFIPLAEEQGYIHALTLIILHKTCEAIRQLADAGYAIRRVSVNVSVAELQDEHFCDDIIATIRNSRVPGDKIAIELTESQNEDDYMLMKRKIGVLKEQGIKFYLDDFGTGYSNMERIMSLPFDIIKFDRSMVIASGSEDRFRRMVANLANMFSDMEYSVLFEGVENDADEAMCRGMSGNYLQGFKYSKPVPIAALTGFLSREAG